MDDSFSITISYIERSHQDREYIKIDGNFDSIQEWGGAIWLSERLDTKLILRKATDSYVWVPDILKLVYIDELWIIINENKAI